MKKRYNVSCVWTVMGSYDIEANSPDEAREKAFALPNPTNPEYLDGSFEIDRITEIKEE